MTSELELRRQVLRGNEYLKVISYAIKTIYERGDKTASSWIVAARDHADQIVKDMGSERMFEILHSS